MGKQTSNNGVDLKPVDEIFNTPERITYDEALTKYGTGRFVIFQYALLVFITWATAINNLGYVFIGATMEHTCRIPEGLPTNISNENGEWANITYEPDTCGYDKVAVYGNSTNVILEEGIPCTSWDYDQSVFKRTIMAEWDLNSCGGKWKIYLAQSMYMIGFLVGCIFLADLSDRFGRSKMMLASHIAMSVSGIAASFSVNLVMLTIMRFLLGVFTAGVRNAAYANVLEIVSSKYRATAGMVHAPFYGAGVLFATILAQHLTDWRQYQLVCACLYLLGISYYWLVPESPRWQLTKGDTQGPVEYFKRSARYSNIPIPDNLEVYLEHQPKRKANHLKLFETPNIRNKTLMVCLMWLAVSIISFGLTFNVGNLAGNIFTNTYILNGAAVFSFFGIWYIKIGRRNAIASAFLLASAFTAIVVIMQEAEVNSIAVTVMAMFGGAFMGCTFTMIYVSTGEIYPTVVRVTALGLGSSLARVGGAIAPFVVLTNDLWPNMPFMIFGSLALISGIIAIKLPETKDMPIPDTLDQAEHEAPLSSIIWCRRPSNKTDKSDAAQETDINV